MASRDKFQARNTLTLWVQRFQAVLQTQTFSLLWSIEWLLCTSFCVQVSTDIQRTGTDASSRIAHLLTDVYFVSRLVVPWRTKLSSNLPTKTQLFFFLITTHKQFTGHSQRNKTCMFHQACGWTHAAPAGRGGRGDARRKAAHGLAPLCPRASNKPRVAAFRAKGFQWCKGKINQGLSG